MEVVFICLVSRYETLSHQILACMKKGGSSEIALAARALGTFLILLDL